MPEDKDPAPKDKEKAPKTKPMPLADIGEYADWVKKQKRPTPEDKGEQPPEPEKLKEPRPHGSAEPGG